MAEINISLLIPTFQCAFPRNKFNELVLRLKEKTDYAETIESELETLRQGEITERAAAAHQHECSARAYEAAMLHVGRAEGLRLRIMELEWQRNAVMVLDGAKPFDDCFQEIPGSPWE